MIRSPNKILAVLTLLTTLTISDFPVIQNPNSKIQNSQVLAQTPDARKAEADRLNKQGIQQAQTGQVEGALQSWQQALIIYREIKDRQGEGAVLGNLGIAYDSLGDYAKAIDYHQQHLAIARELKNREAEGSVLGELGEAYYRLGDYTKTIEYYQQSLVIAREIKYRQGEGASLNNLGATYISLGDYAQAIKYLQQSLAIQRELKNRLGEAKTLGNLGNVYYSLGDYAQAIDYHQQSLVIKREIKNREGEGQSLGNLGNAYDALGDYAQAIDYHQQSLTIQRELKDRLGEGRSLGNLGNAYDALGDYAKAFEYHQQSLTIQREIGDRNGEGLSLNNLGKILRQSGNFTEAENNLRAGIDVWESQRRRLGDNDAYKISIFEGQARTYRILQTVFIAQNQPLLALEISERGRTRAFLDLLAKRNPLKSDSTITLPTIERLQQIAKQQNATLVEYSIITDDFKIKGKQETHESELYIWVIKPTGEVTFRKSDLKPLWQKENTSVAELVTNSRESIGVRNRSEPATISVEPTPEAQQRQLAQQRQKLQQLHQLLIEPIANLLPTDSQARVIFIPQSELFLVPFPALVNASGQYLIEKHTILTAPSIEVLNSTRQQRQLLKANSNPGSSDVLIVGNPAMPKVWNPQSSKLEQLPYLNGAGREAQAISNFFGVPALLDEQATERTIKQRIPTARIIHLATHGLLDYGSPQETGVLDFPGAVALAPGDGEDGLLTSAEILQMNLKAELVVLSACDTGRGKLTGDGVVGLSRSLISAGVPSVIVSLWAVDDAATTELMREFYQQWQQKPDKAQALRQAMLITMKNHPNPRLWAAFTLIGESD